MVSRVDEKGAAWYRAPLLLQISVGRRATGWRAGWSYLPGVPQSLPEWPARRLTAGSGIFSVRNAPANEEPTIDCGIEDDNHTGERELDFSGEAARINDWQEIVLDEALRVAR